MRHLDDGLIAELLDDETRPGGPTPREIEEHLESCAECQHRLAAARANAERARELLGAAAPQRIDAPPFEEILARAAGARQRARRIPYRALGTAAVVAIAAGLGWYVRGATLQTPERSIGPDPRSPAITALPPDERGLPSEPAAERPLARAESDAAAGRRDTAPDPEQQELAAAAANARVAQAAEADAPPVVPARPLDSASRLGEGRAARRDAPQAPAPAMALEAAPFAEDAWRAVPRAEAERLLGGTLALVDGLAVESHRVGTAGGVVEVRTTQVLPDGSELELVQRQRPPAADAEAPAPSVALRAERRRDAPADPFSESSVEVDGFVVTGRARVPLDSLRTLLGRLRN